MNSLGHGFTEDMQGEINITIQVTGLKLFIEYEDNGRGMDAETLSHIFEPFYTTRRSEGNSGLGMHIVYDLITEKLGGSIRAVSRPEQGVHFYLEIPLDTPKDHRK
jgi:signal transduction histidine kinase